MKTFITLLIILSFANHVVAQDDFNGRAIDDFTKLRALINGKTFDKLKVNSNDYDAELLEAYYNSKKDKNENKNLLDKDAKSSGAEILSPTFAIDALGTFIANRTKEEANIAYLNKFTEFINNDNLLELKLLLPETRIKLSEIKDEIYDYKNYFPSLRNNFKNDFDNIPVNFITVFEDDNTFKNKELWGNIIIDNKPYFAFVFDILDGFKQKISATQFLEDAREHKYFKALLDTKFPEDETQIILLITDLSFHSNGTNNAITIDKITGQDQIEDFLALLRSSKRNKFKDFNKLDPNKFSKILTSLANFSKSNNNTPDKKIFKIYLNSFVLLIDNITNAGIGTNSKLKTYVIPSAKIADGITRKDYASAVSGLINLANGWVNDPRNSKKELDKLRKFLTFMANTINAKDGNEMLMALQAAALPVRSYQMKRNNEFTWTIGALGGLGYRSSTNNAGIYAPIGFDFAWGRKGTKKGGNIGFSIPLVDVSAVTAIRLLGNKDPLPDLIWKNVFAPGAFFNWGIRNQPLTVSAGWQYGPGLIEIKNNQAVIAERAGTLIVGISFDIPIFKITDKK